MKKTFSNYLVLLTILLGCSVQCFALQELKPYKNNEHTCENYYIHPNHVFITPNAIYAYIDGSLIQINTLCTDERGVFVPYGEIAAKLVKCPFCQRWYDPERGHPDCPGFPE